VKNPGRMNTLLGSSCSGQYVWTTTVRWVDHDNHAVIIEP